MGKGENFTKMKRKEEESFYFQQTSRTLIRCSGFTLTPGNPPFSFRISLSLSFLRMCVCVLHMFCHSLSLFQSFFIFFIRQHGAATYPSLRNARAFQILVGTTGSAVAMSLSAESNRDTARKDGTKKTTNKKGKEHIRRRERLRREKGNYCKGSDRGEILFFAKQTRTRRCLFCALSSIQNLQQVTFAGNETRNEMYVPKTRYISRLGFRFSIN